MKASLWQKQHIHFQRIVWATSAAISILLIIFLLSLGFGMETAGVFFILVFAIMRILLAFLFKNRYANMMVRTLKFDPEEIEYDFRKVFKNNHIRFYRKSEDDGYGFDFPGRNLSMTVQPKWLSHDSNKPVARVTLQVLNAKNKAFAEKLAESIDEMANQRANIAVTAVPNS